MFDPTIVKFLETTKIELIRIAEDYSSQIIGKEIKFSNQDNISELLSYLEEKNPDKYFSDDFKLEFLAKKEKIEISRVIDVLIAVMKLERNTNLSSFQFRLIKSVLLEIKIFRNLFSHTDTISDELIQRFFEDIYFLFKYIKLPRDNYNRFKDNDSFLNEITFYIQNSLIVNIERPKSFKFEYSIIEEKLNKEKEKKQRIKSFEEACLNFSHFKEEIDRIFSGSKIKQEIFFHNYDNLKFYKVDNVKFFKEKDEYINYPEIFNRNFSTSNRSNKFNEINALSFSNNSYTISNNNNESRRRNDTAKKERTEKDITTSDLNTSNNINSFTKNTIKNSFNNDSDL